MCEIRSVGNLSDKLELADDHGCFACGKSNPIGLKLDFTQEGDEYVTYFTPQKEHQGWIGIVHGGIVCTVLDESMARAVSVLGVNAVTGEITVKFKRPTPVGQTIRFAGRLVSENGRIISCTARATDSEGQLLAEASAKIVKVK